MSASVEMWEEHAGSWRWRYLDGNGTDLPSNRPYDSEEAARVAAATAYPGVPIAEKSAASTKLLKLTIAGLLLLLVFALVRSRSRR